MDMIVMEDTDIPIVFLFGAIEHPEKDSTSIQ